MTLRAALERIRSVALPGESARVGMLPPYRQSDEPACTDGWREAAVLVLLYEAGDAGSVRFPLIRRPGGSGVHAGQMALPGGAREDSETLYECALREAAEETGVDPERIRVVRALSPLRVAPSRFVVTPIVAVCDARPDYLLSAAEVVALYEPALDELLHPDSTGECVVERPDRCWTVPCYRLAGQIVWGATAMMLAELRAMLS